MIVGIFSFLFLLSIDIAFFLKKKRKKKYLKLLVSLLDEICFLLLFFFLFDDSRCESETNKTIDLLRVIDCSIGR